MKRPSKFRIFLLVVLAVLLAMAFLQDRAGPEISPGSTLVLEIGGEYVEAAQPSLIARALGEDQRSFVSLLSTLTMAERDDRLAAVVLVIRPLQIGWGKADELRAAVGRLGDAGRKTVAFLEVASFSATREYYVATAADEIYVVEGGAVPVVGLAAEYLFLGGLWEKLGVGFEVGKAGKYKSAVESYTGRGMSEPTREMAESLLDSAIASTKAPFELVVQGLADGSLHLDELLEEMPGEIVRHDTYAGVLPAEVGFRPVASVALVYGSGPVVQGRGSRSWGGGSVMASKTLAETIAQAAEDPQIDAILLRIDSPGGSALAAEEIWRAIVAAREHGKPIVASFSDLAASGGYYVAAAADGVVSNGGTLTGSIGVFALRPLMGGALDKLGVARESMTRGAYADFLLASEPLSDGARARLQGIVQSTYELFLERVAEGRPLELGQVDAVAQGRVWAGRQALEIGLVDEIGGLRAAVDRIRRALELDPDADVELVARPAPKRLSEELAELLEARLARVVYEALPLPRGFGWVDSLLATVSADGPLLVPPVLVEIR